MQKETDMTETNNDGPENFQAPTSWRWREWLIGLVIALISALATGFLAYSSYTLNQLEQNRDGVAEKLKAIDALVNWSNHFTLTGVNCMSFLSKYNPSDFSEYARSRDFIILENKSEFARECFLTYGENLDKDGDNVIDSEARKYIAKQVSKHLNNYEALALYWCELRPEARQIICEQAAVEKDNPIRYFYDTAKTTDWWRYPALEKFLDCRKTPLDKLKPCS